MQTSDGGALENAEPAIDLRPLQRTLALWLTFTSAVAMPIVATTSTSVAQAGWHYDAKSLDPARCAKDKRVAVALSKQIETLMSKQGSQQYSGSKAIIYAQQMRALQAQASAVARDERTACDGETYIGAAPAGPAVRIISPNTANGVASAGPGSAGLTIALAGDDLETLYAVSLNAGVWSSVHGKPWARLSNSPRYAESIAVDASNIKHLAVGERGGDASVLGSEQVGLWESFDAGATWVYAFDPLTQKGCTSQAVPSLAFNRITSTLVFATTCGVGVKLRGSAFVDFSGNPPIKDVPNGVRVITAVTASETKVWARTETQLLLPRGDAAWTAVQIPPSMRAASAGHDAFALAAFDNAAYFPCCDDHTLDPKKCGNLDDLVIYREGAGTFAIMPKLGKNGVPILGCSGAGLGGSRFVKAFARTVAGSGTARRLDKHLYYSSAEEIYEATQFAADGLVSTWTRPLGAICPGCTDQDKVHSDFWDFLFTPGGKEFVATDGGVYQRGTESKSKWLTYNAGMPTQHAHTLTLAEGSGSVRLVYPTSDNDAWFSTGAGWANEDRIGDVNWSAGDAANPNVALVVRRTGPCVGQACALLTGFGHSVLGGDSLQRAQINNDGTRDGPQVFNFIQSLAAEAPGKYELDALMLATLPLQYANGSGLHVVPGALGDKAGSAAGSAVLLRNSDFSRNPDMDQAKGKGWQLFANNLPAGTTKFWVAGGHANPIVYVLATGNGDARLFKAFHVPLEGNNKATSWTELNVRGSVIDAKPFPSSQIADGSETFGPVFVNPYKEAEVYVLTRSGVVVSENGGFSFTSDPILTSLITASGKYPIEGSFAGGNFNSVKMASRAVALGTLADVSFSRSNSGIAVAVSPFTGVFFRDERGAWYNFARVLPRPMSSPSDARIDGSNIFVSTEGGGIVEISDYRDLAKSVGASSP